MKNIDMAFRQVRLFALVLTLCNCIICCYVVYNAGLWVKASKGKVYVLANGKLLEAVSFDRSEQLPVELRDHIKMFHHYFFTADPDEKVIEANITQALYLADGSAKVQYESLKENGYYAGMISGNISQQIKMDSIKVETKAAPYYFRYFGTIRIIRPTSIVTRSIITEGYVRTLAGVSDHNPHGFLIERWATIENKDINTQSR